jgi:NAD(P)-dependent dehydrogenase (short-subunit alcohol dehydrogenase family)
LLQLAQEGVDVVVAARGRGVGSDGCGAGDADRKTIVPLTVDTSSKVSVDSMVKQAIAALGGIDILVNAAALPGGISSASRLDEIDDASH